MPTFEAKITSKGQITLPSKMREAMRVDAGDKVVFTQTPDGSFRVSAANLTMAALKGVVKATEDIPAAVKVTGRDIAGWIEQARGRAKPVITPVRRRGAK